MGHFWQDEDDNWWLKVFGKGRKLRDTTVPEDYIPFLKRYRASRGLSSLPTSNENTVLVEKIRGQGGMTSRHLRRLVQTVFDKAYLNMKQDVGEDQLSGSVVGLRELLTEKTNEGAVLDEFLLANFETLKLSADVRQEILNLKEETAKEWKE